MNVKMYTYQDLLECGDDETAKADFVMAVIRNHETTERFKTGKRAGLFYKQHDPELEEYVKKVYDMMGNAYDDTTSPNHKLVSNFYYVFTDQAVQYLLGNGISFDDPEIKKTLGNDFDYKLQDMLTFASCDGESYGLYTGNGVEPLCYACRIDGSEPYFEPLYDERDGKLKAGVRYWRLAPNKPLRATLYDQGGYTEYYSRTEDDTETLVVMQEKRSYNGVNISSEYQGTYDTEDGESNGFPIFRMGYICNQSSIIGNEAKLHAYNLILSGYVNNVDMNFLYWVLSNCDGMSRQDDVNFIVDLIKSHVIHTQDGVTAEPHQIQIPYDAREALLERLRKQLFFDFQAVDVERVGAGGVTTVEIRSAYNSLERKCDKLEKYVSDAVRQLLTIMGKDPDECPFHFQRARELNEHEAIQTTILKAPYIGDEAVTKEICEISGKTDEFKEIQAKKEAEAMAMMQMQMAQNNETEVMQNGE